MSARETTLAGAVAELREALDGYRAAVSFIAGDAWDGCWDCIDILKAARAADFRWDWANDTNRIAAELKRIRPFMPERTLDRTAAAAKSGVGDGMSTCNKCGARYRSAPIGTIHKCGRCSGGMCVRDDGQDFSSAFAAALTPPPATQPAATDVESAFDQYWKRLIADDGVDQIGAWFARYRHAFRSGYRAATQPAAAQDWRVCDFPPKGWWCSREAGHEGPCAARTEPENANKAGGLWYRRWHAAMSEIQRLEGAAAQVEAMREDCARKADDFATLADATFLSWKSRAEAGTDAMEMSGACALGMAHQARRIAEAIRNRTPLTPEPAR